MKYVKFWIALSVAAAGLFFLFEMASATSGVSNSSPTTDCTALKQSVMALKADYQGRHWDRLSSTEQRNWMTQINMVINDPQCFPPELVAAAQAARQSVIGH